MRKMNQQCRGSARRGRVKNMRIRTQCTMTVLAKNSREGSDRNTYYDLAVFAGNEAGNINCSEDAYNNSKVGEDNELFCEFNSQYKSFRIYDAVPVSSVLAGSASFVLADADTDAEPDGKAAEPKAAGGKAAKPDKPGR